MATIGLSGGMTAGLGAWIRKARQEYRIEMQRRRLYRETHAELDGLSDRDLQDIGISRMQIPAIAREAAYGSDR
jgi:uncharacterized protein YjiS (DUF1127 family)